MALTESTQVAFEDFEAWLADLIEATQVASENFEEWTSVARLRFVRNRRTRISGDIQL